MTDSCPFCDEDRIAGPVTYAEALGVPCMVFAPLNPVTIGHVLVAPVEHVRNAADSPYAAAAAMMFAAELAQKMPAANIITSIGAPATQSVFHLHVHVVPRRPYDGLHLPWTGQQVSQTID